MKKILFANIPFDGHFNPLTGIAVHLQSLGHDVRWYTASAYQDKVAKLGLPFYPFRKALDYNQYNLDEVFPERLKFSNQILRLKSDLKNSFVLRAPEFYDDIREINETWDFDMMISDVGFTGIPFVKDILKKRVVSIGVFPLAENSRDLPPAGMGIMPSTTFWGKVKQDILRFVANQILYKESSAMMNKMLVEHHIKTSTGNIIEMCGRRSDLLLQSGTPGFEYPRTDLGKNIRFIGALLPYSTAKTIDSELIAYLKNYSKVILVTQGTLEKDPEKLIIPTLEAFKDSQYLVVATTGGSKTKELQKAYPQSNIVIRDFIPFGEIMPYCNVYITNGGYGGVMLGIENRLPLVVAGIHEGKNEINARVDYFKIGIDLKTEFPKASQIKESVERVLTDSRFKVNVEQLGKEFKNYDTLALCERYINEVLDPQNTPSEKYPEYI